MAVVPRTVLVLQVMTNAFCSVFNGMRYDAWLDRVVSWLDSEAMNMETVKNIGHGPAAAS